MPEIIPKPSLELIRQMKDVVDTVLEEIEATDGDLVLDVHALSTGFVVRAEWTATLAPELVRRFINIALNPALCWQHLVELEGLLTEKALATENLSGYGDKGVDDGTRS